MASSRIAFGSCNSHNRQNNLWGVIEERKPAGFIWGGDAVYGDHRLPPDWSTFPPKTGLLDCADGERLRRYYNMQKEVPEYKRFLQTNVTVFGTFDDHDYGCNNADRTFPHRVESAEAFVDFIGEPKESVMAKRASAGFGAYGVKLFDFSRPAGQQVLSDEEAGLDPDAVPDELYTPASYSNRTVAVFVLDVRSNKTPWKTGSEAYKPDLEGDFLGERQWQWFETAIARSRASVNVVVNGLQVHANIFPDGNIAEAWGKYPNAQQRLFDAVLGANAPILISGDVHMAQFMRKDCKKNIDKANFRPLVEMTTSGMTHSWGSLPSGPMGDFEWRPSFRDRYESFVAGSMMRLLNLLCPWTDIMVGSENQAELGGAEGAKTGRQFSLEKNFGELEFDWDARTVSMRAVGEDGDPLLSAKWSLDQLSGRSSLSGSLVSSRDYSAEAELLKNLGVESTWTCVSHRGRVNAIQHMFGHVATGAALILLVPFPLVLPTYFLLVLIRRYLRKFTKNVQESDRLKSSPLSSRPL